MTVPHEDVLDEKTASGIYPIPFGGLRIVHPSSVLMRFRAQHLSKGLYPIAVGNYPQARNHRVEARRLPSPLLLYCSAGRGEVRIEGRRWAIGGGDACVLRPSDEHAFATDPQAPWSVYWIYFDGLDWEACADLLGDEQVVYVGVSPTFTAEFDHQFSWREHGYSDLALIHASCRLKALLVELAAAAAHMESGHDSAAALQRARSLMKENLGAPLRLADVAAAAGLSPFHFTRKFRASTGYSPLRYLTILRMQHACALLDDGALTVREVAGSVGYDDPYHFSRVFRRVIGMSPTQYRATSHGPADPRALSNSNPTVTS